MKFTLVFITAAALAIASDPKRDWQEGIIESAELKYPGHLHPMSARWELEILGNNRVRYLVTVGLEIHRTDFIPGVGIVAGERQRSKVRDMNIPVGSTVRFAISGHRGWMLDPHGHEQRLIVRKLFATEITNKP